MGFSTSQREPRRYRAASCLSVLSLMCLNNVIFCAQDTHDPATNYVRIKKRSVKKRSAGKHPTANPLSPSVFLTNFETSKNVVAE